MAEQTQTKAWADMSPRERDALVAEKAMGWTVNRRERHGWRMEVAPGRWKPLGREQCCQGDGWSPSTDIAAAWEVVEKMHADGNDDFVFELVHEGERPLFHLTAAEAAERICLAALRAKGVKV